MTDEQEAIQIAKREAHVGSMAPGEAFRFGWGAAVRWFDLRPTTHPADLLASGGTEEAKIRGAVAAHDAMDRALGESRR